MRGKWLLENILGAPPPPPPPDVPALEGSRRGRPAASVRERMEVHRKNPVCAAATCAWIRSGSRWRTSTRSGNGARRATACPIDAARRFRTARSSRASSDCGSCWSSHRDEFVRTLTEKLLTYALGRGVEYYDLPAVRQITRDAAPDDYRWSALILGIVKSTPFTMAGQERIQRDAGRECLFKRACARIGRQRRLAENDLITKKAISRRTVLRGLGATLALPLLDSMVPAFTAVGEDGGAPVNRLGVIYVPNGMIMQNWAPIGEGVGLRVHADA